MNKRIIGTVLVVAGVAAAIGGTAAAVAATAPQTATTQTGFVGAASTPEPAPSTAGAPGPVDVADERALGAAMAAALEAAGPGTVIEAEFDDDPTHAYEIDIRLDAGGFAEVKVAADFSIVDVRLYEGTARGGDDDTDGDVDSDEVTDPEIRRAASDAALAVAGGGTVVSVEASDDADHVWEVEVEFDDGRDMDFELDANFRVIEVD